MGFEPLRVVQQLSGQNLLLSVLKMSIKSPLQSMLMLGKTIDRHVCWDRQIPFMDSRPRKTNFRFPFPFAANKRKLAVSMKLPFSVSSVCSIPETWRRGDGNMETLIHGILKNLKRKWKPRRFSLIHYRFLIMQQKFVLCPFVDEHTYGHFPFANGLNGLAHL